MPIQNVVSSIHITDYLQALALLVIATLVGQVLRPFVAPTNLVMLYLLCVVIAAGRWGYGSAIMTSLLSVLVFNFFFVPHEYTLHVVDTQYILTFAGLLIVGVTIAHLTYRLRQQMANLQRREQQTADLYALSQDLIATFDENQVVQAILKHISKTFHAETAIFLNKHGTLRLQAKTEQFFINSKDHHNAQWAFDHGEQAGYGTFNLPDSHVRCIPLTTVHEKIGVLLLELDRDDTQPRVNTVYLMDAFANQAALALEAARFALDAQQTCLLQDRAEMQSILLNSISHDLRTPLSSIAGTLSTLRDKTLTISETAEQSLLEVAWQESQRLNRTVANLLDMTRLESDTLQLTLDWFHMQELIANARQQLGDRLDHARLVVDVPSDLPLIQIDMALMTQVVINLLDNAVKYSDTLRPITIRSTVEAQALRLDICDEGIGIPPDDVPHIFERFYRSQRDGGIAGTGLGLSICQGIVRLHQGTIIPYPNQPQGTIFRITLPVNNHVVDMNNEQ